MPMIDIEGKAEGITSDHWTNPNSTVSQLKAKCLEGCVEILNKHDRTWDEVRTDRDEGTRAAKQHVCAFVYLVLQHVMSEVEMSAMTGIKRSCFRYCRIAHFEKNGEQSTT